MFDGTVTGWIKKNSSHYFCLVIEHLKFLECVSNVLMGTNGNCAKCHASGGRRMTSRGAKQWQSKSIKNWFHRLMWIYKVSAKLAKNRMKIIPVEAEIQPAKGWATSLRLAPRDVICLPPLAWHLAQFPFVFDCISTFERHSRNFRCSITKQK